MASIRIPSNHPTAEKPCTPVVYKFRTEILLDVERFITLLPLGELIEIRSVQLHPFPDHECTLSLRSLSLGKLRRIAAQVPNGHVLLQSLQRQENYTGERNLRIWYRRDDRGNPERSC